MDHPLQPFVRDEDGTIKFKENKLISFLLDHGPFNLTMIKDIPFSENDKEQLIQLIGYTFEGFGNSSFISDKTYKKAQKQLKSFEG